MKKRRKSRKQGRTADVASAIGERMEKRPAKPETSSASPPEGPESGALVGPAGARVWKWARRVVLGYDRTP